MAAVKKIIILNEVSKGYGVPKGILHIERAGMETYGVINIYNLNAQKAGDFWLGLESQDMRLQKFGLGRDGKISRKFRCAPETNLDGKLAVIVAHLSGESLIPVLYGANHSKKLVESSILRALEVQLIGFVPKKSVPIEAEAPRIPVETTQPKVVILTEAEKSQLHFTPPTPESEKQSSAYADSEIAKDDHYPDDIRIAADEAAAALAGIARNRAEKNKYADWDTFNNIARSRPVPEKAVSYYQSVKKELDQIFTRHPAEAELNRELRGTRWVKVPYAGDRYYVIGLIGEPPEYIAYGVPGRYSLNPPKELAGVQWLPVYDSEPEGNGYWIMYQDSRTGEAVDLTII